MQKDILKVMLNPIRMRIIQAFVPVGSDTGEQMTANDICEFLDDIPRTTLYRHINVLIKSEVLSVVSERRIRGSVERTLALNMSEFEKLQGENVEDAPGLVLRYLMEIYAKFDRYFRAHDKSEKPDTMFLSSAILMLGDEDFKEFLDEMQAVLEKYRSKESTKERKPRDISFICAPPDNTKKNKRKEGSQWPEKP